MKARLFLLAFFALVGMRVFPANFRHTDALDHVTIQAGLISIDAEVARDEVDKRRGLMGRESLAKDSGMLFIFQNAKRHCFWMKDTLIPLSIAFINEQGIVMNVDDMEPQSTLAHCSAGPSQYALEVNRGAFQAAIVATGTKIFGLPKG